MYLIPYIMQNIKFKLFWNDEMQNIKILRVMFSFIQNVEFIVFIKACDSSFGFFGLLRQKSKIKNSNLFVKKNYMTFSSII